MAQTYKTGLIITGDASGGIRAIKATDDELGKLNQGFDRGARRSKQFTQNINGTSRELQMLRRAAAPIAGVIAGMFAANSLQNQINWGDQLQKTNLRIGASTEALSQYNYVASLSGVEFNQLTTAWQRQTRRIAEAAAGTGVAVAALDRLNLSAQELNQLAPEDQFERIAEAMQGVENSSERVRLAQQLWDSEGVKLVQIVNQGTDAMATMRAEADALGLTISQDTANAMASYNDEVDRLKFAAQGVSQTLLSELVPAMTAGLQNVNAFIQEVGGAEVVVGHLTDGAQVLAALLAGRYAGAFATATAAKLAATQQAIAYQMALARMAGVSATAAGAQASLAAATRGAAGAMALMGGPLGLLIGAGGLLYMFREELGFVKEEAGLTEDQIRELRGEMQNMSRQQMGDALGQLNEELSEATLKAAAAREQLALLRAERDQGEGPRAAFRELEAGGYGAEVAALRALQEAEANLTEIEQRRNTTYRESIRLWKERQEALQQITEDTDDNTGSTDNNTRSTREAAKQTTSLANSYENLLDRIQPNRRAARQYAQDVGTLNLALATGRINAVQYMQAMGLLQESFQAAQREAENTATASEDASQRIANSFLSWETVADNTLRRIDDSGQSLWLGLIDGSESALDTVKRGFQQSLAEIAHMLTTQKLTFEVAGMMGLDTTGMPGGGGGFNLSSLGSLKNGWDTVSGLFGGGSAASGGLYANALTGSAAAGGLYAGASTGAAVGGLYGNALTGAATTASGGFMSAVGSAMPWIGAGLLVDNLLGLGITDGIVEGISSIFGGGKSDPRLNISTRGDAGQFSHESVRTGAFGAVGFSEGTKRSNDLFGSVEQEREWLASVAALDNLTAAAARTPEQLDAMTAAVQNMVITSEDAQGAIDQLAGRTAAATSVIDSELTQSLIDAGATAEQIAQRFATASSTIDVISAASARLNLQYDANADGALRYADSLVQAFGSLDSIAAIQDAYYNAAFSDQERLQHQFDDVRGALNGLTDEAPRTVEELRAIVEASQLNGEASQKLAYDLMALAPALKQTNQAVRDAITQQYQDVLGRAPAAEGLNYWFDQVASGALTLEGALSSIANSAERLAMDNQAIWDNITSSLEDQYRTSLGRDANAEDLYYWMTQIESGAVSLDQALQLIASSTESVTLATASGVEALRKRAQLERQLLTLQGDTAELRRRELEELNPANRALQTRIWNLEYEKDAQAAANRAQQERIRNLEQEARAMMSAGGNIRQFVESLQNTAGAGLSPEAAYQNAEESFLAAISTIYTSDDSALVQDTINGITGIAQQYLAAAEAYGASGNIYQQAQALVEGSLDDLAGRLGSDELTDIDPQLEKLIQGMDLLNESIAKMASDLNNNFDMLDTSLDGVIDFEEFKDAFGDILSNDQLDTIFNSLDANMDGVLSATEAAAANTGLAGPLAKQVPLAQTFSEFFGGSGSQNYMYRQLGALAGIEAAIRDTAAKAVEESTPQGRTLSVSQAAAALRGSGNSQLASLFSSSKSTAQHAGNLEYNLGGLLNGENRGLVDTVTANTIARALDFDESRYFSLNQDVAAAVSRGEFASGLQHFVSHGLQEGRQFYEGGYTGPGGKYEPAGIVHRGEVVWSQDDISAWGGVGVVESLRNGAVPLPAPLPMPNLPLPQFPALGQNDVAEVLRDLKREVSELRKENARLQGASNKHLEAANVQRGAAATQQIAAIERSNKFLKRMEDDKRLEAAKR